MIKVSTSVAKLGHACFASLRRGCLCRLNEFYEILCLLLCRQRLQLLPYIALVRPVTLCAPAQTQRLLSLSQLFM